MAGLERLAWLILVDLVVRYVSFMASVCHFIKKESDDQTWLGSGISPHLDLFFFLTSFVTLVFQEVSRGPT